MTRTVVGRPVRVGAIGAGWWATTNHFPALAGREDVDLVAVCRPDVDMLLEVQRAFGFRHATEDFRELLDLDLDAVIVSTPHFCHYEHARAALDRSMHVLCEKPMTLDPAQAWDLVHAADAADVHLLVPYGWHYQPFIERAKQIVDSGILGEIDFVSGFMASPTKDFFAGVGGVPAVWTPTLAAPDMRTWQEPSRGGGYAHGQLTHVAAMALWLTGLRVDSVSAVLSRAGAVVDMYDAAHVRYSNGAIGTFTGAATLPADRKFQLDVRVFGALGVLLLDVERERAEFALHDGTSISVDVADGDGAYSCETPPGRFIDLITGTSTSNNSPGELGARTVELIDAIVRSAGAGGVQVGPL